MFLGLLYFLLVTVKIVYSQDVFVEANDGILGGQLRRVYDSFIEEYLGIPYADPPVGELRFTRPVLPKKWNGVRNAVSHGPVCPQPNPNLFQFGLSMNEDCLYLNVHTSARQKTRANLPVMVYIHGGGFLTGSGAFFDPSLLAVENVVTVTINYRLGILGFLSLGDSSAPGNYGLLDQVMALEWVRDNIVHFGGNPNDVTLMGFSAGSGSVSLHQLSPLSRGLFNKVIQHSGSSMAFWAASSSADETSPRDVALILAGKVNCSGSDNRTIIDCLRGVSPTELMTAAKDIKRPERFLVWAPVIETFYNFLPDTPRAIAESVGAANVSVLLGVARAEYAHVVGLLEGSDNGVNASVFERKIHEFATNLYPKHRHQVEEALEKVYLESIDHTDPIAVRASYVKMLTDAYFTAPVVLESELLTKGPGRRPVYLYQLAYSPENNPAPRWQGVTHRLGMMLYTFGVPITGSGAFTWRWPWVWTEQDRNFSRSAISMTISFIKTGNPTPDPVNGLTWKPFTSSEKNYAVLDLEPKMKSDIRPRDMKFWNSELPKILSETEPATLPPASCATWNMYNINIILALIAFKYLY